MSDSNKTVFDMVNDIWDIADYLRDVIKRSEYNRIVLPFSLLRRLECALEPTRDAVLEAYQEHQIDWGKESDNYCTYSEKAFYNITSFRLNNLGATDTLTALETYINGFSPNAREIMKKFKIFETCQTLQKHDMLYEVCQRFGAFKLGPNEFTDRQMSDIYEHLIQKYGEQIAEDAEDFMTPKDAVRLAVSMLFANEDEILNNDKGDVKTLYDPTAGTCGFITDALDMIEEMHKDKHMVAATRIVPYGQEVEAESYAMGKANLLIRNIADGDRDIYDTMSDMSQHIVYGDTLADDKFSDIGFDYQLSNPPYGKKWEKSQEKVKEEAELGFDGRFGAGLPPINDGSMLFLQHVIAHMKSPEEGGGKAGIVLSASPLFTGEPGKGCSNIRRWIFENDFIDCIVKLPSGIFFRTSINTYLWILSNKKPEERKGLVQLIDASDMKEALRKNLGKKNAEISPTQISEIVKMYVDGVENEKSVIVPYSDFTFRQVITRQPLHMGFKFSSERLDALNHHPIFEKMSDDNKKVLLDELSKIDEPHPKREYEWRDEFVASVRKEMTKPLPTPANFKKMIDEVFGDKSDEWDVVIDKDYNPVIDPDKNDKENIPTGTPFDEYMRKEVLPFAPETWIDTSVLDEGPLQDGSVGVLGTNISFNKYFYHYEEPRKPEDIASEVENLESELNTFMRGVFDE